MNLIEEIKIENMTIEDLNLISDELGSNFDDFWNYNVFRSELENGRSKYLVAKTSDNLIIGSAGIIPVLDEADISNIVVRKDYRNKKIGSKLLECLISLCSSIGIKKINLEVKSSNQYAIQLYKTFGFTVCGLRKKYYNNNEDAILMNKSLDN